MYKKIQLIILILLIILLAPFLCTWANPASYVEEKISFHFSQEPQRIYRYDFYKEGKDYDALSIYQITSDFLPLEKYMQENQWNELPLANDVITHPLCNISFDPNMERMLQCANGYWRWHEKSNELIVYDTDTHIIYIRTASVYQSSY